MPGTNAQVIEEAHAGQRKPPPSAASREAILDAARELMGRSGYQATSISAICRRSGLPVGSVYHHFGSKAGLLKAVLDRGIQRFFGELESVVGEAAPAEHRLRLYYAAAPEVLIRNADYFRITTSQLANGDTEVLAHLDEADVRRAEMLAAIIRPVAQRAGVADPDATALRLARFTITYTRGALMYSGYDLDRLRRHMAPLYDVVLAAITVEAANATGMAGPDACPQGRARRR